MSDPTPQRDERSEERSSRQWPGYTPSNHSRATLVEFGWGGGVGGNQRALYKAACLTDRPRWRLYRAARREGLSKQQLIEWLKTWIIGKTCRGCDAVIEAAAFAVWNTYWTPMWGPCHAGCREVGMKAEAYECQCIDADCNDCRHYQRNVTPHPDMLPNPRLFPPLGGVRGNCLKFGRTVIANPKRASCNPCFEHRRSPAVVAEREGVAASKEPADGRTSDAARSGAGGAKARLEKEVKELRKLIADVACLCDEQEIPTHNSGQKMTLYGRVYCGLVLGLQNGPNLKLGAEQAAGYVTRKAQSGAGSPSDASERLPKGDAQ